jgi:hypothetical protein
LLGTSALNEGAEVAVKEDTPQEEKKKLGHEPQQALKKKVRDR